MAPRLVAVVELACVGQMLIVAEEPSSEGAMTLAYEITASAVLVTDVYATIVWPVPAGAR